MEAPKDDPVDQEWTLPEIKEYWKLKNQVIRVLREQGDIELACEQKDTLERLVDLKLALLEQRMTRERNEVCLNVLSISRETHDSTLITNRMHRQQD